MMTDERIHPFDFATINASDVSSQPIWNGTEVIEFGPPASTHVICLLTLVFVFVGVVGVCGNSLVGAAILGDSRMRRSPTNALILNLAVADLIILLSCVPDIVQFIGNRGWRLGLEICKILRFAEVFALYASVMTLLTLCIERYVAILHPIQAHILCCRSRIVTVLVAIWPLSMLCASPNLLYHVIEYMNPDFSPCVMQTPRLWALKCTESILFYFIPLIIQVVLYFRISVRLFRGDTVLEEGSSRHDSLLRARRGVVKMLVAGVVVYFVSFSPHQVLLLYNSLSSTPFQQTWSFLILVNLMAYCSSACNPLLYSAFSHKFRRKFALILGPCATCKRDGAATAISPSTTHHLIVMRPHSLCLGVCKGRNSRGRSVKTTVTEI